MNDHFQVVIVGGGIGGLICANYLAREKIKVCLIERKNYPFHRVCGEYISNEARPFLESLDLFPASFNPPQITHFCLTSVTGKKAITKLDMGGFGISRYTYDTFLAENARKNNVTVLTGESVTDIKYQSELFRISTPHRSFTSDVVIGAFGKRSVLDRKLNRQFLSRKSPYLAVKYHVNYSLPRNEIQLHNFRNGYCGISNVENNEVNLCYLSSRSNLKKFGSIPEMEKNVLYQNPFLKEIWENATFLFNEPVVINEINFESKKPVESHILMVGDSAGMIAPLCGNGMAMAIHSAKIACEEIIEFLYGKNSRKKLESDFRRRWKSQFSSRLATGRNLQKLFGSVWLGNLSVNILNHFKSLGHYLISKTHGHPF